MQKAVGRYIKEGLIGADEQDPPALKTGEKGECSRCRACARRIASSAHPLPQPLSAAQASISMRLQSVESPASSSCNGAGGESTWGISFDRTDGCERSMSFCQ